MRPPKNYQAYQVIPVAFLFASTLKTRQVFSVLTAQGECKNTTIIGHFGSVLKIKVSGRKVEGLSSKRLVY